MFSGTQIETPSFINEMLLGAGKSIGSWFLDHWIWFVGIIVGYVVLLYLYKLLWNFILDDN